MAPRFFLLSAGLTRKSGLDIVNSHMAGYRVCETEHDARDSFIDSIFHHKPGFDVDELLCREVCVRDLLAGAGISEWPPSRDTIRKVENALISET